ncbi:unnamed protein product [Gordionus sp. m RMFG-2023]
MGSKTSKNSNKNVAYRKEPSERNCLSTIPFIKSTNSENSPEKLVSKKKKDTEYYSPAYSKDSKSPTYSSNDS